MAASFYLEYLGWWRFHTWSTRAGSWFIPGVSRLTEISYLEYVGGLAAVLYLECVWKQVHTWFALGAA
jgi:hypothetical protein